MLAYEKAKQIMGVHFLDFDSVPSRLGGDLIHYDVDEVPYTEDVLRTCKSTHLLARELPFSIIELRYALPEVFNQDDHWYDEMSFARRRGTAGSWRLVRTSPRPLSLSKSMVEQTRLLHENEAIPTAQCLISVMVLYRILFSSPMFVNQGVRTRDSVGSDSVIVGSGAKRIGIAKCGAHLPVANVGIGIVRMG